MRKQNLILRTLSFSIKLMICWMISTTLTFNGFISYGIAHAQQTPDQVKQADKQDSEDESLGKKIGQMAVETGKSVAIDAAKSIAIGAAASAAEQAALSATIGGAAVVAAKKAAVVAKNAIGMVNAVKRANELRKAMGDKTAILITAIVFGLVGTVALVACKKKEMNLEHKSNVPAPSFYLWTVGSIAFMISEIVHFIKFKKVSRKIASTEFKSLDAEQKEALLQQKELMEEALKTAKGKLTWTRILNAAYIAAGVAAAAELVISVATNDDVGFVMHCGKEKDEKEKETKEPEAKEPKYDSVGKAALGGAKNAATDQLNSLGSKGMDFGSNLGSTMGSHFGEKGVESSAGKFGLKGDKDVENTEADYQKQVDQIERETAAIEADCIPAKDLTADDDPSQACKDDGSTSDQDQTENGADSSDDTTSFNRRNLKYIDNYEYQKVKEQFELDLYSYSIKQKYFSSDSNDLITAIMESESDVDTYFIFDEWHRYQHGARKTVSIDQYERMKKMNLFEDMPKDSQELGSLKQILVSSLSMIQNNLFIGNALAKGGGGAKAGKAAAKFMVNILAGLAEGAATSYASGLIEKGQEQDEVKKEQEYARLNGELDVEDAKIQKELATHEKKQEELENKIESLSDQRETLEEEVSDLNESKDEAIEEARELASEEAEDAEDEDDEDEDDDEDEEEILMINFVLEEEEGDVADYDRQILEKKQKLEELDRKELELKQELEAHKQKGGKFEQQTANVEAQREQLDAENDQEDNSLTKKGKDMLFEKGGEYVEDGISEGVGAGRDFLNDKIDGIGSNKNKKGKSPASSSNLDDKTKADLETKGKTAGEKVSTQKEKGKLKEKINGVWDKLMGIFNKLFKKHYTRAALCAATIAMINLWILKDIKKNVSLVEKNLKEVEGRIAELEAQEAKELQQGNSNGSSKYLNGDGDEGRGSLGYSSQSGGKSYSKSLQTSGGFAGADGICLAGQGSSMKVDNCSCKKNNSCTNFSQNLVASSMFPKSLNGTQRSVFGMADQMANGEYKNATLSGMKFAKNAVRMLKRKHKLEDKVNKMLLSKGMKPINFSKNAKSVLGKIMKVANTSGIGASMSKIKSSRGVGLSKQKSEDAYLNLNSFTPGNFSTSTKKSKKGGMFDILDEDSAQQETHQERAIASLEEYDVAIEDIQDRPKTSIFDIISVRYIKSAYPALLNKRRGADQ